jgi:hypothetical protein
MLCAPVGEPPDDIPSIEIQAGKGLTMRQQMEAHRSDAGCTVCHRRIDPPGFSLENYDAIGRWRTADSDGPIDPSGVLPGPNGPMTFRNFQELRGLLKDDPRIPACTTRHLMTYALGRSLTREDEAAVDGILAEARRNGFRIQDLLAGIAMSAPFRERAPNNKPAAKG